MRDFILHSIRYSPTDAELTAEVASVATRSDWAGESLDSVLAELQREGLIVMRGGEWQGVRVEREVVVVQGMMF